MRAVHMSLVRQLKSMLYQLVFNRFNQLLSVLHLFLVSLPYFRMLTKKVFSFIIILHCHKLLCQLSMVVALLPKLVKLKS